MTARRKWIPIVIGAGILLIFVGIGVVIFTASYIREHFHVSSSDEATAARAFDEVLAKFPGAPLLDPGDGQAPRTAEPPNDTSPTAAIETLHLLVWNPEEGQLARFEIPFWIVRLSPEPIGFSAYGGSDRMRLRPEEIERHGPGIVLDFTDSHDHNRVLVWVD